MFDHSVSHDSHSRLSDQSEQLEFSVCIVVCTRVPLCYTAALKCLLLLVNVKWENVISQANK